MASYIIVRSDEYLAHHGIKGQKWGKRRWQNEDGSLTAEGYEHYGVEQGGNKKLDRLYKREAKRMQKLADRTDVDKQAANVKKYTKRALISAGVGAVGAGVAVGSKELNNHLAKIASAAMKAKIDESDSARRASENLVRKIWDSDKSAHDASGKFVGYSDETWDKVYKELDNNKQLDDKLMAERRQIKDNFNQGARIRKAVSTAGWVVAAAGAGMAAYNAVQAGLAKRRISELGHDKAVKKAEAQVARMQKMFANTPYAELVKDAGKSIKHSDELCHYGIKGQKWGVRRFENVDGTLTPEGKVRYGATRTFDRKAKKGELTNEKEIRELYTMEAEDTWRNSLDLEPRFPYGKTKYSDMPIKERLKVAWYGEDKDASTEAGNIAADIRNAVKKSGVIAGYYQVINTKEYQDWEKEYIEKDKEVRAKYADELKKTSAEMERYNTGGSYKKWTEAWNKYLAVQRKIENELAPMNKKENDIFDKFNDKAFDAICNQLGIPPKDRDEDTSYIIRKGYMAYL